MWYDLVCLQTSGLLAHAARQLFRELQRRERRKKKKKKKKHRDDDDDDDDEDDDKTYHPSQDPAIC